MITNSGLFSAMMTPAQELGGPCLLTATAEKMLDLVARIESGDTQAEAEMVQLYARGIKLVLLKRTGNPHLVNDLVQETFVVTLKKLRAGDLRKPESLSAFIRQTAVNISIDHFRKERRYIHQDGEINPLFATHIDNKGKELDSRKTRELLETVLDQLAVPRDRELLRRFYLHDEDKKKICVDLALSASHFDRVLYRAKQRMRELIDRQQGLKSVLFGSLFDG